MICANAPSGKLARIVARYSFEAISEDERLPIGEHIHRFGEDILISLIMFARHDRTVRLASLRRTRVPIFVSRRALEERLGSAAEPVSETAMAPPRAIARLNAPSSMVEPVGKGAARQGRPPKPTSKSQPV